MRPRRELLLALFLFAAAGAAVVVSALGTRPAERDARRSTFLAEPGGARAWTDAAARLGHDVTRWRRPLSALGEPGKGGALLAIIDPDVWLGLVEQEQLQRWLDRGGDLLLAGPRAGVLMRCAGWRVEPVLGSPGLPGAGTVAGVPVRLPAVRERLVALRDSTVLTDTSRVEDLGTLDCRVRRAWRADTLLRAPSGAPLAVRITPRRGGTLTLVADGGLFTNRALRETAAGEFSLALLRGGPRRIVVDEYHHGFGASGSMTAALWDWSTRSPWGWALWQALLIGVVALLAATVRSGPVHELPGRARRSPLEHVRALARTLAASRGHDVAVSILARGLRRRLSADGRPSRDDPRPWLAALGARVRTPAARRSAARLLDLTRPGRGADEVLAAAHAVEELWQELRP